MYNNKQILDTCDYILSILFTQTLDSIDNVKTASMDVETSLLSELSLISNEVQETIDFNRKLISSQYIDYLKVEIRKIHNITTSAGQIKPLIDMSFRLTDRANNMSDSEMSEQLKFTQTKLSKIFSHDINKSSILKPISKSKANDFIFSVKNKIISLTNKCNDIVDKINDCVLIADACNFSKYYLVSHGVQGENKAPILEESRDRIMTSISAEYVLWKESTNGSST